VEIKFIFVSKIVDSGPDLLNLFRNVTGISVFDSFDYSWSKRERPTSWQTVAVWNGSWFQVSNHGVVF